MQSAGNFTHQTFPWVAAKADETLHQILTIYPLEHVDGLTAEYEQHETEEDVGAAKKAVHQQSQWQDLQDLYLKWFAK